MAPTNPTNRHGILLLGLACATIPFVLGDADFQCVNFEHTTCQEILPYTEGFFPNVLNLTNPAHTEFHLQSLAPLLDSECGAHIKPLMCSLFYPECDGSNKTVSPCREVCENATKGCEGGLAGVGLAGLDCSRFPETGDCYPGYDQWKSQAEKKQDTEGMSWIASKGNVNVIQGTANVSAWFDNSTDALNITSSMSRPDPASASCNCSQPAVDQDMNAPSNCVQGDYNCRHATVRGYINGQTTCCLDGKQLVYTSSCVPNGLHVFSCTCVYPLPPGTSAC